MSLSEMKKSTYKAHSTSIRANGEYHALKWIKCPLEREDMKFLCDQEYDHLLQRVAFRKIGDEGARVAFMLTTTAKGNK